MDFYCQRGFVPKYNNEPKGEYFLIYVDSNCTKQCFECMANVGDRRLKTKEIISKQ